MNLKKVIMKFCLFTIFILVFVCTPNICKADGESVRVDCDGGTYREMAWANAYEAGHDIGIGESLSDNKCHLEDPTDIGRDFIGWNIYSQADGTLLQSMYTTQQVLDYKIPCPVLVKAQYNNRAGAPVTAITYAAIDNDTGEPVWDAKITLINDGVSYSGYGYVSISEDIYSKWTNTITYIVEAPGWYQRMNGKWCDGTKDVSEGSLSSFKRHKSQYYTLSLTGKGKEIEYPRSKINDMFYEASFVKPNVSKPEVVGANTMISDTTAIPSNATIEKEVYESGKIYDTALTAAQNKFNTSNILVVDLELMDSAGALIHQLIQTVQVRLDVPSDYVIQSGNTVVVYYLEDDGSFTECPTTYHEENGSRYVLFETNHFSTYVMMETLEKVEETTDTKQDETTEITEGTDGTKQDETAEITENVGDTEKDENKQSGSILDFALPIIILVVVLLVVVVGIIVVKKRQHK